MMIIFLALQGAVFAIWAVLMFRALFRLLAEMRSRSGLAIPGLRSLAQAPGVFLRDPMFAFERRIIPLLTVILLALSAGFAALH